MNDITPKEAIANLNHIYGFVAPDIQRSLDVAIKALERPKGEWIECRSSDHWKCDKCGHPAPLESRDCEWLSNFCPDCGADMRAKENKNV